MSETERPTCQTCAYWRAFKGPNGGECRRDTPFIDEGYTVGQWPSTEPGEWCGQHSEFAAFLAKRQDAIEARRAQ